MSDQYIEFNLMDMQMDESGKQYIPADKWKDISNEYYEWTRKTSLAGYHTFYPGITGSISLYVGYPTVDKSAQTCTCDMRILVSVGCQCGGI